MDLVKNDMDLKHNIPMEVSLIDKVGNLEKEFLKLPQADCPVVHSFGQGTYIRQVTIPAGTYAIGHHQNFEHINFFVKGKVSMLNDDGSFTVLTAPMFFIGKPGRKVGYAHEDVVWLNIYQTDETSIEQLEARLLTKSDNWVKDNEEKMKLLEQKVALCQP